MLDLSVIDQSSGNHLNSPSHCDLDLWPTKKSKQVKCQSWETKLSSFMILDQRVLKLSSGNHIVAPNPCDLNLWPTNPKIQRGHLPVMNNLPMRFHDPRPKRSQVIILKPFDIRTDGPTDRPTDISKTIFPLFSEGRHKKGYNSVKMVLILWHG